MTAKRAPKRKPKSKRTTARRTTLAGADLSIVAHDATSITVGGFASVEIVGWHFDALILTCPILERSGVLHLGDPPTIRPLAAEFTQACATARDGRFVALLGLKKKDRYVRLFPPTLEPRKAVDVPVKRLVEFASAGFTADGLIALPGAMGTHRRAFVKSPQQPYVMDDDQLVPIKGVGLDGAGGSEDLSGVVACGDGRDLVVWCGRVFERRAEVLVRVLGFDLERNYNNFGLTVATTAGPGFFTISGQRLVEVIPGDAEPRVHLPKDHFRIVRPGPDGLLLLEAAHDTAKKSALWLYDPKRKAARALAVPGGTYPMTAFYAAARRAIGLLASENDGTAGQRIVFVPAS